MSNKKITKVLGQLLVHLKHYNNMSPFPVYDTEYVAEVEAQLDKMENTNTDYDELPVDACKHCKSLFITVDETDNDVCQRCNSINEIKTYNNIEEYLEDKNIWNEQ